MGRRVLTNISILLLVAPVFAGAQVEITEIMYDLDGSDGGREWIEVQNTSSGPVDLTDRKLFENKTNHGLVALGDAMLAPGTYAVIADNPTKFKNDWPNYQGPLFDSAFALSNTGETLVLRCCGKDPADIHSVTYESDTGARGDGLSLHRSGASFSAAEPSPGSGVVANKSKEQPKPKSEEAPKEAPKEEKQREEVITAPAPEQEMLVEPLTTPEPAPKAKKKKQVRVEKSSVREEVAEETSVSKPEPVIASDLRGAREVAATSEALPASSSAQSALWWVGAGVVSVLGAGAAYAMGRARRREWDIEEID